MMTSAERAGRVVSEAPVPTRAAASWWLAAALVGAALSCSSAVVGPPPALPKGPNLRSPFDRERRQGHPPPQVSEAAPRPPLPVPPQVAPVIDVLGVSYYVDDAKSMADPGLKAQNTAALAPLREFVAGVIALADADWVSVPGAGRLAVSALAGWARARALLGRVNPQGVYEVQWTLGSLALAYLKVRAAPDLDPVAERSVVTWFRALGARVRDDASHAGSTSSRNNHAYWAGLAVAAAGIACNDPALFGWGIAQGRVGLKQVDADGHLPLELARGVLALHYHVFALAPLVMLAELAAANGIPLWQEEHAALGRLANGVIVGLADPVAFGAALGIAQQIRSPPGQADLAWAELYYRRFRDERVRAWLVRARPLADVRLGGSTTLPFAEAAY